MKLEFSRQLFEKYWNVGFHKNPSSGNLHVPCGRRDGDRQTDMTKLTVRFSQFREKRPKNELRKYAKQNSWSHFNKCLYFRMKLVYWLRIMESTEACTGCRQAALVKNMYHSNENKAYIIAWTVMNHLIILYLDLLLISSKILFSKKLRADWGQEMLAIIRCRIFCLPGCYPKI